MQYRVCERGILCRYF